MNRPGKNGGPASPVWTIPLSLSRWSTLNTAAWLMLLLATAVVGLSLIVTFGRSFGMWGDELGSLAIVRLDWNDFIRFFAESNDLHPPLYYSLAKVAGLGSIRDGYVAYPWVPDDLPYRTFGAVFYLITLSLLAWYAWRHSSARWGLAIAAVVMTLSAPFLYLYSEFRMYGMLTSLAVATLLAISELSPSAGWRRHGLVAVLMWLMMLTHYFGIIVAGAVVVAYVVVGRFTPTFLGSALKISGGAAALMVPYLPVLIGHISNTTPYSRTLAQAVGYARQGLVHPTISFVLLGIVGWGAIVVMRNQRRSKSDRFADHTLLLTVASVLVMIGGAVVAQVVTGSAILTFSTVIVPVTFIFIAVGLSLAMVPRGFVVVAAIPILVGSVASIEIGLSDATYFEANRLSYRDIIERVDFDSLVTNGELVVVTDAKDREFKRYVVRMVERRYPEVEIMHVDRDVMKEITALSNVSAATSGPDATSVVLLSRSWGPLLGLGGVYGEAGLRTAIPGMGALVVHADEQDTANK